MGFYTLRAGTSEERKTVREWLVGLNQLSEKNQDMVVTAWMTSWKNSTFERLEDMAFSLMSPEYRLTDHVNDVTTYGMSLANDAIERWGIQLNWEELLQALILHDVDKPLLFTKVNNLPEKSPISRQIQHGVLGALILNELGFSEDVISTVATHATNSPFHGSTSIAYILHYADLFAADYALMKGGVEPFYQRHKL